MKISTYGGSGIILLESLQLSNNTNTNNKEKEKGKEKQYTAISLFSGCGGSSLGYQMAGFKILLASEFIEPAQEVYRLNFPNTVLLKDDIRKTTAQQILDAANLKKGELDLLDGSPPCSAFSTAGTRQRSWNKSKLYSDGVHQRVDDLHLEFTRILEGVQPKTFLVENVPALAQGYAKGYFNEMFRNMIDAGYNVKACILNAMNYGVAQSRQRLFFIGVRKDLENLAKPSFPKPNTKRNNIPTVGDVLRGVKNEQWEIDEAYKIAPSVRGWLLKLQPGQRGADIHPRKSYYSLERLSFKKPSPTVTTIGTFEKTTTETKALHKRSALCHPLENRYLTISELKRVSSFPDDFKLTGNFIQQWERIGRAVPPVLMKNIALHIKNNILDKCNHNDKI